MDRELLQDSDGVNESFWDGLGVEFEARYFLEGIWGSGGWPVGGEWREDSDAVNESFWDAPAVEIEAKQDFGFWAMT